MPELSRQQKGITIDFEGFSYFHPCASGSNPRKKFKSKREEVDEKMSMQELERRGANFER